MISEILEQVTLDNPVIVAAIVSAVVALAILGFKEGYLEPRRWKKEIVVGNLEKQLQVYGELIMLLESCKRKAMRQDLNKSDPSKPEVVHSHLLENPLDIDRLQQIFEKSPYLLSDGLLAEWYKLVREDEFFQFLTARQKGTGSTLVDLRKMQEIAENEYAALKQRYAGLVDSNNNDIHFANSSSNGSTKPSSLQEIRGELVRTIILLVIATGLVINGLLYAVGTYEFVPTYKYDFQFNSPDHFNKTRTFYSVIEMSSKAFAAHTPIHVSAKVVVIDNATGQTIRPEELPTVYVVFPRSHMLPLRNVEFPEVHEGGTIEATFGKDGKGYWSGEADLQYEMQGSYIVGITSKPVDITEDQDTVRQASFINIASEEVTSNMITNRIIIGLTYSIMGIALLTAIPVINQIMSRANEYDRLTRK